MSSFWAPFTQADLSEARNGLGRLGQLYALRLPSLDDEAFDAPARSGAPDKNLVLKPAKAAVDGLLDGERQQNRRTAGAQADG